MENFMNTLDGGFVNADCTEITPTINAVPAVLLRQIPTCGNGNSKTNLNKKITNIFMVIGIPAHIKGYHFLREAVKLAAGNFDMINCMTKKLYPLVARQFNTNACTVERGIRNAIEIAWARGKIINLNTILGLVVFGHNDKPSNGELIALLAEKIYLDCV